MVAETAQEETLPTGRELSRANRNCARNSACGALFVKVAHAFWSSPCKLSYKQLMTDLPPLITSTEDLDKACAYFSSESFITVDTEFLRQTTYRPKLCLIQMAASGLAIAVDPLAGLDLSRFYALMANEAVVKVFH